MNYDYDRVMKTKNKKTRNKWKQYWTSNKYFRCFV